MEYDETLEMAFIDKKLLVEELIHVHERNLVFDFWYKTQDWFMLNFKAKKFGMFPDLPNSKQAQLTLKPDNFK